MRCVAEIVAAAQFDQRFNGVPVAVRLPSFPVVALYKPDLTEHARRVETDTGAVCCTSTLSALWEMPAGISVPTEAISLAARRALLDAPGLLAQPSPGWACREYEPCGAVTDLFCTGRTADIAIRRASLLSAIFQRWAVLSADDIKKDRTRIVDSALERGIGIMSFAHASIEEIVAPASSALGRPHVFRWWMAEMAYAAWLATTTPTH